MDSNSIIKSYKRVSGIYDLTFGQVFKPGQRALIEKMVCSESDTVLEIGIGTGSSFKYYPKKNTCEYAPPPTNDKYSNKGQTEWIGPECYLLNNDAFAQGVYNYPSLNSKFPPLMRLIVFFFIIILISFILVIMETMLVQGAYGENRIFMKNHVQFP